MVLSNLLATLAGHKVSRQQPSFSLPWIVLAGFCLCSFIPSVQAQSPQPAAPSANVPADDQVKSASAPVESAPPAPKPISRKAVRRKAWQILQDGVTEKSADRRGETISALGTIGIRRDVVKLVEGGLDDKALEVRQIAAATIGAMKSRSSIPRLRAALDDPSVAVDFTAARALWAMGDHSGASIFVQVLAGDRKTTPGLIHTEWHDMQEKLHDPRGLAEFGASEAAGAFLGPGGFGITVIEELAKDKTSATRAISAQTLGQDPSRASREALETALNEKSWLVRASAAEALGQHGLPRDIDRLAPLLEDNRAEVRYNAAASIVRLSSRPRP